MTQLEIRHFSVDVDDDHHDRLESGERIRIEALGSRDGEVFFIVGGGVSHDGKWRHPCVPEERLADWLDRYDMP